MEVIATVERGEEGGRDALANHAFGTSRGFQTTQAIVHPLLGSCEDSADLRATREVWAKKCPKAGFCSFSFQTLLPPQ